MGVGRDERQVIKCSMRSKLNLGKEFFLLLDFFASFWSRIVASLKGDKMRACRKMEPLSLENARMRRVEGVSSRRNVFEASEEDNS